MTSTPVVVPLLEALFAPTGHELESLVVTTYSLDPSVLLAILSATCLDRAHLGVDGEFRDIGKEEWRKLLLENLPRCVAFVDHHGEFENGGRPYFSSLAKTALDQVVKHMGRGKHEGGSLHSKLVLAIFKDGQGRRQGRLYIGSKNLTLSTCEEFGTVYDLLPARVARNTAFSAKLVTFLEYLRTQETRGAGANHVMKPLAAAIGAIKASRLEVLDTSSSFHWQSRFHPKASSPAPLHETITPLLAGAWDAVFIHSPWARKSIVEVLDDAMDPKPAIVIKCLKEPQFSALDRPNVRYDFSQHSAGGPPQSHHSHAKIYFFSRKKRSLLVFGSANLTPDGWGLSTSHNCRPNTEILVSHRVDADKYAYLAQLHGVCDATSAEPHEESAKDRALAVLNGVDIQVDYSKATNSLVYEISLPVEAGFVIDLTIAHELVESREAATESQISVFTGWPPPLRIEVPWAYEELHLLSGLMRIACPSLNVETHLIVDLPAGSYQGREKLRAFRYTGAEVLQSLAKLMQVPLGSSTVGSEGSRDLPKRLSQLLAGARVEQYAYRLARIRKSQPLLFQETQSRVDRLLREVRQNPELSERPDLQELSEVVSGVHNALR